MIAEDSRYKMGTFTCNKNYRELYFIFIILVRELIGLKNIALEEKSLYSSALSVN
jgi:hypothetical protein